MIIAVLPYLGVAVVCLAVGLWVGVWLGSWYWRDALAQGVLNHAGIRYRIDKIGRQAKATARD